MFNLASTLINFIKSFFIWLIADPRRVTTIIVMTMLFVTLMTSLFLTNGPVVASPMATSGGP